MGIRTGDSLDSRNGAEDRSRETCRLYRIKSEAMVCGVCAGLAKYLGIDASIVRLLTLALVILNPLFLLLYIAACIIVPEAPRAENARKCVDLSHIARGEVLNVLLLAIGALLILVGIWIAVYGPEWIWRSVWVAQGILLVIAGTILLILAAKKYG